MSVKIILTLAIFFLCCHSMTGQTHPIIKINTITNIGDDFKMSIGSVNGAIIDIDYGDSVLVRKKIQPIKVPASRAIDGTAKGQNVVIYVVKGDVNVFYCRDNSITNLDVSQLSNLVYLNCEFNRISHLDLSSNTALETLRCSNNRLKSLNISNNKQLKELECQFNELTTLDLSNNPLLEDFKAGRNSLKNIDVSNNLELNRILLYDNSLTKLNLNNNKKLQIVSYERNPELKLKNVSLPSNSSMKAFKKLEKRSNSKPKPSYQLGCAAVVGYTFKFMNESAHQAYLGADFNYSPESKYPYGGNTVNQFSLGGGVYLGSYGGKSKAIPAVNIAYSTGGVALIDFRLEGSPYYVAPIISFNAMNLLKLNIGYNLGFKKINNFDTSGLTIGLSLSIGVSSYYVDISN